MATYTSIAPVGAVVFLANQAFGYDVCQYYPDFKSCDDDYHCCYNNTQCCSDGLNISPYMVAGIFGTVICFISSCICICLRRSRRNRARQTVVTCQQPVLTTAYAPPQYSSIPTGNQYQTTYGCDSHQGAYKAQKTPSCPPPPYTPPPPYNAS